MERFGKAFTSLGKLGTKVLEGAVEGAVDGALKSFEPDRLGFFIRNNYYIIESAFYGLHKLPIEEYMKIVRELIGKGKVKADDFIPPDDLSDEEKTRYMLKKILAVPEVKKIEAFRRRLAKIILPIFGMARSMASKFPRDYLDKYLTGDWLYKQIKKRHPELTEVIDQYGEKGREWIENESKEIREYISGKLIWDPNRLEFITPEEYRELYGNEG